VRRRGAVVAGAGVAALALALAAFAMPSERAAGERFTIAGSVDGLYPGVRRPLRLRLRNPNPYPIVVLSVTVRVRDAGAGCRAPNLALTRLNRRLRIRGRASRPLTLWATLAPGAPDACQGARFRLAYSGRAVRP
jgi:hypothetical protein